MHRDVLVRRAPLVVAREERVEGDDAVGVRLLHAPQEGGSQSALAGRADAAVDAGGVALPQVDEEGGLRGAGAHVDELDLEVQRDARQGLGDVAPDLGAEDVVGPDDVVRGEDAGAVGAEDFRGWGGGGEGEGAGAVVGGGGPFGELGGVATVKVGGVWGKVRGGRRRSFGAGACFPSLMPLSARSLWKVARRRFMARSLRSWMSGALSHLLNSWKLASAKAWRMLASCRTIRLSCFSPGCPRASSPNAARRTVKDALNNMMAYGQVSEVIDFGPNNLVENGAEKMNS